MKLSLLFAVLAGVCGVAHANQATMPGVYGYEPHDPMNCTGNDIQTDDRLQCMAEQLAQIQQSNPHLPELNWDQWPGNRACSSCYFFFGLAVSFLELCLMYVVFNWLLGPLLTTPLRTHTYHALSGKTPENEARNVQRDGPSVGNVIGWALAVPLFLYYFIYTMIMWNFISWVLLVCGMCLTVPSLVWTWKTEPSVVSENERKTLLFSRLQVSFVLLGLITLALFPNVTRLPDQVTRHVWKSNETLTPFHPSVVGMVDDFHSEVPKSEFHKLSFDQKMRQVADFVNRTIIWHADYSQYGMIGLLVTPDETISRKSGDCQGQCVTTVSMLLNMGYEAYACETPFHWWTHVRDPVTGQELSLNMHGWAWGDGSVRPQPIDLVYTWYPPRCDPHTQSWCDETMMWNEDTIHYMAPPHRALMIALTGVHEFHRDIIPSFNNGGQVYLVLYGSILAFVFAFYSSFYQADLGESFRSWPGVARFLKRFLYGVVGFVVFAFGGMWLFANYFYQLTLIHLIASLGYTVAYITSNSFNAAVGTPRLMALSN